jgi:bacteriorhodopsin
MIYTGFLAILASSIDNKFIMYAISCFLFILIFVSLFKKSSILFWYLFIVWAFYPIFWIFHENKSLSNDYYDSCISILDLIAKIGFSFLI